MQNLEVKEAILMTKKTKSEIKKELEDSIANGKKNENTDIEEIVNNCMESKEDPAKVIHEFEEIIKNRKSDIVCLAKKIQQTLFTNLKKLLRTKKVT